MSAGGGTRPIVNRVHYTEEGETGNQDPETEWYSTI